MFIYTYTQMKQILTIAYIEIESLGRGEGEGRGGVWSGGWSTGSPPHHHHLRGGGGGWGVYKCAERKPPLVLRVDTPSVVPSLT